MSSYQICNLWDSYWWGGDIIYNDGFTNTSAKKVWVLDRVIGLDHVAIWTGGLRKYSFWEGEVQLLIIFLAHRVGGSYSGYRTIPIEWHEEESGLRTLVKSSDLSEGGGWSRRLGDPRSRHSHSSHSRRFFQFSAATAQAGSADSVSPFHRPIDQMAGQDGFVMWKLRAS